MGDRRALSVVSYLVAVACVGCVLAARVVQCSAVATHCRDRCRDVTLTDGVLGEM